MVKFRVLAWFVRRFRSVASVGAGRAVGARRSERGKAKQLRYPDVRA